MVAKCWPLPNFCPPLEAGVYSQEGNTDTVPRFLRNHQVKPSGLESIVTCHGEERAISFKVRPRVSSTACNTFLPTSRCPWVVSGIQ